jgi:hypothetical protein
MCDEDERLEALDFFVTQWYVGTSNSLRFHFHDESAAAFGTLILDGDPVVAFVIGDLCQLTPAALKYTALQIEAVRSLAWIRVRIVWFHHFTLGAF